MWFEMLSSRTFSPSVRVIFQIYPHKELNCDVMVLFGSRKLNFVDILLLLCDSGSPRV